MSYSWILEQKEGSSTTDQWKYTVCTYFPVFEGCMFPRLVKWRNSKAHHFNRRDRRDILYLWYRFANSPPSGHLLIRECDWHFFLMPNGCKDKPYRESVNLIQVRHDP